jgi:hypothetical protein
VIGGSWGAHPAVLDAIRSTFERFPRHVPVRAARVTDEPSLVGARSHALAGLRSTIVALPDQVGTAPAAADYESAPGATGPPSAARIGHGLNA